MTTEQRVRLPQAVIVKDLAELLNVTPIDVIKELMNGRMYPTTLVGLERAMKLLAK